MTYLPIFSQILRIHQKFYKYILKQLLIGGPNSIAYLRLSSLSMCFYHIEAPVAYIN